MKMAVDEIYIVSVGFGNEHVHLGWFGRDDGDIQRCRIQINLATVCLVDTNCRHLSLQNINQSIKSRLVSI